MSFLKTKTTGFLHGPSYQELRAKDTLRNSQTKENSSYYFSEVHYQNFISYPDKMNLSMH